MKRARAGSISGRLRSASDLEEKGLIDKSQKGVLKDLIISGDAELQAALDLYDDGDASQLEGERDEEMKCFESSFDMMLASPLCCCVWELSMVTYANVECVLVRCACV